MESSEQRDETHVEQHGDGDVNVTPPEPAAAPEPGEQGGEQGQSEPEEG